MLVLKTQNNAIHRTVGDAAEVVVNLARGMYLIKVTGADLYLTAAAAVVVAGDTRSDLVLNGEAQSLHVHTDATLRMLTAAGDAEVYILDTGR